ncbi:Na+/H+ antiporter NhaA [Croceibacterium mercuriale]|uniref:Na+/H+ antiporter NhaA n=1 Tax=Croceibacterium mercuriale TaxID=1572751 RepID=UPI0038990549
MAGKQLGIFGSAAVADRIGFARRLTGVSWGQLWGTSTLCGISFTISLFISALAVPNHLLLWKKRSSGPSQAPPSRRAWLLRAATGRAGTRAGATRRNITGD